MFFHIYKTRIKCITRDKQMMFWTLLFPVILGTLFYMALSDITSHEVFKDIKIAVVDNKNDDFRKVLDSVSGTSEDKLFDVKYTNEEEAKTFLKDDKIDGYILPDQSLVVKNTGLNQTLIKTFLDDYKQTTASITSIVSQNPQAMQQLISRVSDRKEYLKELPASESTPDTAVNYFYTLIAMACLYGSFLGLKEVMSVQANLTSQAARVNLAPTHKLKVFTVSMLAAATIQLLEIIILLAYLTLILKINFGNQLGFIALTCLVGTMTGVTFGAFIAAVIKKSEGVKTAILISTSMAMSFLSGMMYANMKLIIAENVPILSYLNPANLIADAFYALYYYTNHTQFTRDILMLCVLTLIFSISTYFVIRRQKYASL